MSEIKRRIINYKLVKIPHHPLTLQDMLEATLLDTKSDYHFAARRRESLTEDGKSFRLINRFKNYEKDMFLCQIVQFEQGRSQMTIEIDEGADMFEVKPISSKDIKKGKAPSAHDTEFLESMLYFGIMGNHMVVMGSQSLKSRELERHLNWYLKHLTNQVDDIAIMLSDKPTNEALVQLSKSPAKSVEIGSSVTYEPASVGAFEKDVNEVKNLRWSPAGLGANILECLKDNGFIGNMDFEESLDDANLQVSIEFKYKRKTTKSGQRVLDTLSNSLRHVDKDDIKIRLKGGGVIQGDDLKLSTQISIPFLNDNIDESALYYSMRTWLNSKITTNEVTADLNDLVLSEES